MPKQIQSDYDEVRIPFTKMSFTPDIPSTMLGPNEYNDGINVESDIRGIRSTAGDTEILDPITGTPIYVTSGFRQSGEYWFIVATVEGYWYCNNGTSGWLDITPGGVPFTGYAQNTNITEAWNGTVPIFNDSINPPMFLPDTAGAILVQYSNLITPSGIDDIVYVDPTTQQIQLSTTYATAPYIAGQKILISNVNNYFNGEFTVVSSTTTTINYTAVPGAAYPGGSVGTVSPAYTWNYNPNWKGLSATFMRMYSTPNVGSILVAGGLTATNLDDTTTTFPVTVQWSQAFGLNQAPLTWQPTITNIANQLEVPLRGQAIDAFPSNGQFFLCSYWDTVVFSPINYSTTSAPILGVRLYNQGRGLLSSNCWGNTDKLVYGLDSRDIWVFDGNDFTGIGNQRVKNWFYDNLDPTYYDRVHMEVNTQRNQVEIYYYTTYDALESDVAGVPNFVLSYRYDIDVWNAPRRVTAATFACESPIYELEVPSFSSRTIVYARAEENSRLVMKDQGYTDVNGNAITSRFRRDNIKMLPNYSGKVMVHRILPEAFNVGANPFTQTDEQVIIPSPGSIDIKIEGAESVASLPVETTAITMTLDTNNPWVQIGQNSHRVNSIEISNTSNTNAWLCSATTWQYTQVEDDR
jgi:hypothetical protein